MYKPKQQDSCTFRFRRFCRAKWAAYSSMHREITIGQLAARVADSSLAKGVATVALAITLSQGSLMAQSDDDRETRTLPEVTISLTTDTLGSICEPTAVLTAKDFQQTTIHSIGDLAALLPGVELRIRGGNDVQGDLSMRGGTFDQMLVLLNGINLTDAQTGHHTMDIPLDICMVERIELLTPSQCLARGLVALCGAVNIIVSDQYCDRLLADISGGSNGTANAALLASKGLGRWTMTASVAYHRSDGYRPNTDYRHGSLFLQAMRHGNRNDWQLQLGGQMKNFGGAGFYSTTYPDQYEATRSLVASASNNLQLSSFHLQLSVYGRLHRDHFELFRDGYVDSVPSWYSGHNHHLTSLAGGNLRVEHPWGAGSLFIGADIRREGIRSNVLGSVDSTLESPYNRSAERTSTNLYGGYHLRHNRFSTEVVALGHYNSHFGPNYGLAVNATYQLNTKHLPLNTLHLSASRTYRLPTFTDLYYQSVNQQANPDLNAENSTTVELTLNTKHLTLNTYYRSGNDIIGWVRPTTADLWLSMNHTSVNAIGLNVTAIFQLSSFLSQLTYSLCHIESDNRGLLSSSAIDHLGHKLQLWTTVQIYKRLRLKTGISLRHREGQYVEDGATHPYGNTLLLDAAAEYTLRPIIFYLECHNLLNHPWHDLGGVPQPGLTLLAGMRLRLEN